MKRKSKVMVDIPGKSGRPASAPKNAFGRLLAKVEALGYTRAFLSSKLGVHLYTYGCWRRGERLPSPLARKAIGMELDRLMDGRSKRR